MLTIKELSKKTGLEVAFIRRCVNSFEDILEKYIHRGNNNSIVFDSNALVIFDRIGQFKKDGLTIPDMKIEFEKAFQTHQTVSIKPFQSPIKPNEDEKSFLLNQVLELNKTLIEEKEKRIQEQQDKERQLRELERSNMELREAFKLLPEGKTPQQIKDEWEEAQKRKLEEQKRKHAREKLLSELKETSFLQPFKRSNLIKRLEELL